jgi:hypothetical protein
VKHGWGREEELCIFTQAGICTISQISKMFRLLVSSKSFDDRKIIDYIEIPVKLYMAIQIAQSKL